MSAASGATTNNIVLVHGGFVDGSGWEGVYHLLRKDGYRVSIVQHPTISLAEDVRATLRVIAAQDGPVVLVGPDGWDRGDPAPLDRELARVRRSCRRLIWLNPLLGSAQYEPLTLVMQAALRHVDHFLPAHNIVSLEQLAEHLRALPARTRPVPSHARHRSPSWSWTPPTTSTPRPSACGIC